MTSAWKETPGRDDRAEGQDIRPSENQLEMLQAVPCASSEMLLPSEADLVYGSAHHEGVGPRHVVVADVSARDFLDADGVDSDELRRLENSIRWLMNES